MKDTYLKDILDKVRNSILESKKNYPQAKLESKLRQLESTKGFRDNLITSMEENSIAVIAEMKKASPSQGLIRAKYDPEKIAKNYKQAKAACLSVLTEEPFFEGSLKHLSLVRECVDLPILRKNFIIDEYQIYESRCSRADCILLIAAALTQNQLYDYHQLAIELGLDVLIEVHTFREMQNALKIGPNLVGINNRNLQTFKVNLDTTKQLFKEVPEGILVVSESGIKTKEDVKRIISFGVNAFLVGEVFMRAELPGDELRNLFFN